MDSPLDRLARLLPPPEEPVARVPWHLSRPEIGFDFPADYREFVDQYGGGSVVRPDGREIVRIHGLYGGTAPRSSVSGFGAFMAHQAGAIYESFVFDGADEDYWGGTVYPVQPDPGGLLAWGENIEGDIFFWLTEDPDPDNWPVVMWARGPATTFRFAGGMIDSLVAVFSGSHAEIDWLADSGLTWVKRTDWRHHHRWG